MNDARVSVIVPCYNAERYLGEALESVLTQPEVAEVLLVDDGSTDGSVAVAESFGSRVQLTRQANGGASAARNSGVQRAGGDFIAFLDADDVWTDGSLAVRVAALEASGRDDGVSGLTQQFLSPELSLADRTRLLCPDAPVHAHVPGALLVRRTVFARVGLFDEQYRTGEMLDWVSRASAAGVVLAYIDALVMRRRIHATNTVHRQEALHGDYLRVLKASIARRRMASVDPTT